MSIVAPYGTWPSPIRAARIAQGAKPLSSVRVDGECIYWLEGLADQGGRLAAVASSDPGRVLTPEPLNLRSRVHEYGGGAMAVAGGVLYFSNFSDNLVYRQQGDTPAQAITANGLHRHADFIVDAPRARLIAVREDHSVAGSEPCTSLVALGFDGQSRTLAAGCDFYAAPRLNPAGTQLAWISWNHPHMPWTRSELWLADIDAQGQALNPRRLAGGGDESLVQPCWSPGGQLFVVSDRSGFWNLYRVEDANLVAICPRRAEFGRPHWVFGQSLYGFASEHEIIAICIEDGVCQLGRIALDTNQWSAISSDCSDFDDLRVGPGFVAVLAASPTQAQHLQRIDLASGAAATLARSVQEPPDAGCLSVPEPFRCPSANGRHTFANFYPPQLAGYQGPSGSRPPLIVTSHGGPTSLSTNSLKLAVQYWTSRGIAVIDVNYGGSTGFGRKYMQELDGQWGIVDVDDCIAAAQHAVAQGWVDGQRMAIRGGSASGFTTLCALAFHTVFKAGASYYGVSDLAGLDADTHKFESRYTHSLVAPPPENVAIYAARSPSANAQRLSCPMIFFQGSDDKVVPPAQSEIMVSALKARGIPVAYLCFDGEGHGFRRKETVQRTLEAELYFYGKVFGFAPADAIAPVEIAHGEKL